MVGENDMIENAKWIWADCDEEVNQYADFIKEFEVDNIDKNAYLEICSDRDYAVWINGEFVSCGQYNDFPHEKVYDTLSVAAYLKKGINRLCITAQYQGEPTLQYAKSVRGVCFALVNGDSVILSDSSVLASKSKTYKCGDIAKIAWQLGYSFEYDARFDDDWRNNAVSDRFSQAVEVEFNTIFSPRPIKKLEIEQVNPARVITQGYLMRKKSYETAAETMQRDFLSHREFDDIFDGSAAMPGEMMLREVSDDGVYVIVDLGQEESGYLSLDIEANEGARVDIGHGEHLEDMRVRTFVNDKRFANTYYCKEGRQNFTYYFKRIAGRYIELHITNLTKLKLFYVGMNKANYPLQLSEFMSSDKLHNMIYDVSVHTLRQCMHEHYEDCPWREQALYASDSRNQMLCGYYTFGEFEFPKQSLKLLSEVFEEDGYQRICAPTDVKHHKIPSFTMIWFLELREYIEHSGDVAFGLEMWEKIEWAMEIYTKGMQNGLVECPVGENIWNFYEWSDGSGGVEYPSQYEQYRTSAEFLDGLHQAFAYLAIKNVVMIANMCGKNEFAQKYACVLKELGNAINNTFWNEEKGVYCSYVINGEKQHYCELMQAICIVTGLAGDKASALCEELCNNKELIPITLSYAIYRYEALFTQNGKYDDFVFDEIARRWGKILRAGATTFWETEGGAFADVGVGGDESLCHGWSAIPTYLYFRYALGIGPEHISGKKAYIGTDKVTPLGECSGKIEAKRTIVIG